MIYSITARKILRHCSYFGCYLFLLMLAACSSPTMPECDPKVYSLTGDTICEYPFFPMGEIMLNNDHLAMINPMDAEQIQLLDTQTGQMTYLSIKDSLNQPGSVAFPLSFFHYGSRSYFQYEIKDEQLKIAKQNFRFKNRVINRAVQLNKRKYVTLGFFQEGLLGLYDKRSKKIDYFGHYPVNVTIPFEKDAKNQIVQFFQGNIAFSEKHSKVVYCSDFFAYISCYQFTGRRLKFRWEQSPVPLPTVSIVDGSVKQDRTVTNGGFSDVSISGDYIFASYRQNTVTDSITTISNMILAYDMDGNHIATYHTDCSITKLKVDIEKKSMYGLSVTDDPVIVRFSFEI